MVMLNIFEYDGLARMFPEMRACRRGFQHSAVRRQISPQHSDATGANERFLLRENYVGIVAFRFLHIFPDRFAGDSQGRGMQKPGLGQLAHHNR